MKCPYCNARTKVTNSRSHNNDYSVWRRRQCKSCNAIWSTDEQITLDTSHKVVRSDNHLEPFSRDVLFISIFESLAHRNDRLTASTALINTVIDQVLSLKSAEVPISKLVVLVGETLNRFDKVAASVYKAKYSLNN